ncbi:bifunctional 3-(3-hydroxy-phenyl)propionate/3-hydroxycinnamic acid hydroxylase MhpA [Amycolatopsis magusensis]|uniref:bifunctional 3-(3-hydroxy-phenyl)propionate/3-hydroxycinnamic acid hydroxylase MhpA n=1 Tax=Amycolatopsis magusensis TaxID=882444 RepID=UPI0024A88938|nr:bifunctional 3-(3-hydroxy-phenyl)propionate/3-hydroxycinnamic acid hydroxylase [Amycolatopsis magusensis]MDI5975126.1 bifunctional 3-(3-hydroxy-phenyl)propionate/3-hydroxycinnamic acid hydroxylase [Amycolatopsis magusensis]
MPEPRTTADVVIVGNGPAGQTLSMLLAQRGWRVIVLERWPEPYPFPRVKGFDGETARNFAAAGIGEVLPEIYERLGEYEFLNADGQRLMRFDVPFETGRDGWPPAVVIHHPTLEAALSEQAAKLPTLKVLTGHTAIGLVDHEDHVEVEAPGPNSDYDRITASWVIGCDGANSFVREHIGSTNTDLGFKQDWLLCDVLFNEPREFHPNDRQICDPLRPTTMVASGRGHRRWEFRRLPGETVERMNRPENVWRLLKRFDATPENATLCRHTMYTFQARIADKWREGRVLIAGDAAHLMPPFAGQGMCSGVRDAANLAWKLDLVLRGVSDPALLDEYPAERDPQVRHAINVSVEMGKIISELDTVAAANRDAHLLGMQAAPSADGSSSEDSSSFYSLEAGVIRLNSSGAPLAPAGELSPQGQVARGASTGLFDDIVGRGFVLISTFDPFSVLDSEDLEFLDNIGAHLVRVLPSDTSPDEVKPHEVVDVQNVYLPYLAASKQVGALVRPDFYLFGGATDRADLSTLVRDLRTHLTTRAKVPALP